MIMFLRVLLGGVFNWIGGLLSTLFKWTLEHPAQAICIVLLAVLAWLMLITIPGKDHQIVVEAGAKTILAARYVDERNAHNGTIFNIERGKRIAAEMDRRNLVRVKAELHQKLTEISNENDRLRSRNRSLVIERLRQPIRTAQVDTGSGGAAKLPILSAMPGGIVPDTGAAIISESDALICADNYSQLTGLIAAWKAASAVDVNGELSVDQNR